MLNKNKFFAVFALSASLGTAIYTQTPAAPPAAPSAPSAPPRIERQMQIFTNGGDSYLGVWLAEVTKDNFGKFGLKDVRGAGIEKVSADSPAAKGGLQDNDVIVRFDGEEVSSVRKLQRLIAEVAPDHQARVTVLRNGNERELTVTLGKRPTPQFQSGSFDPEQFRLPGMPEFPSDTMPRVTIPEPRVIVPPSGENFELFRTNPGDGGNWTFNLSSGRRIGINSMALTKQLGDYFGVADGRGVLVSAVSENSPAARAGLKAGDVIIEADGKPVATTGELTQAFGDKTKKTVNLTILRNENRQTVTVEPEESRNVLRTAPATRES